MRKLILKSLSLFVLIAIIAQLFSGRAKADNVTAPLNQPPVAPARVTTSYTTDNSIFSNPERGFHNRYDIMTDRDFSRSVSANNTLVHSYVRLDSYRSTNLPQSVLDQLNAGLSAARSQGMKVILRVSYNFGPYPNSEPDATEAWINQHLSQLAPVLSNNQDVIAFMEAGFIGAWGEWHTSTNGLDTDMAAKIRILNSILSAVPSSRQVVLRYPSDVRAVINGGVSSARLGNHQDCFLASDPDDWGTWARDTNYTVQQDKDLIASVGVNHPVGGETCNPSSPRVNCTTATTELQAMHFSDLNEDYEPGVITVFKNQGCFDDIKRKLGYRFRLTDATYPTSASSGSSFNLQVNLTNDGYASPYNQHPVFAVLDGAGGTFTFPLSYDPRNWKSGQAVAINQAFTLPAMPAGNYRLSLWLPDNATNLRSDPRYSIRFANQNTWDSAKGYNVLANTITIGGGGGATSTPTPTATNTVAGPTNTPTRTPTATAPGSSTSYEAESASNTLAGGAAVSACAPCSGGNKVGYVGNNAGTLQFNGVNAGTTGTYTVTVYYANGDTVARNASLSVNGGAGTNLSFPVTGGWTTVGSIQTTVSLNAGTGNTLKFSNASGWAPDFDRITVNSGSGPTPTPTNTPIGPTNTPTRTATATPTNTVAGPTNTPTRTPTATATTGGGTTLVIDSFSDNNKWSTQHLNDLNKSVSWAIDSAYYGDANPGNIVMNASPAGQYYQETITQSLAGKTTLVLRLRDWWDSDTENHWNIVLNDGTDHTVSLSTYGNVTASFTNINIPLSAFGANLANTQTIRIVHKDTTYAVLLIDTISAVP